MSNKSIYDALRAAGMTKEGTCGLMGNMMAESGMKSNIAQRGMTKLTDEQYTAAADNGLLDFRNDGVGFGLLQHTYPTRKAALLQFAKSQGVSVGDEAMQVQFCIKELKHDYPALWEYLCSSHDLYMCAQKVCLEYERPAVNNVDARYNFAKQFYLEFATSAPVPIPKPEQETGPGYDRKIAQQQILMKEDGYWDGPIDGKKTPEWKAAFQEYAADVLIC